MAFIDISTYRVRIPADLYPFQGSHVLEVSRSDAPGFDNAGWSKIPDVANFRRKFEDRNPFNIPGPFYGAQTDTCLTGPYEAPHNVMVDGDGQEFVYRQPTTIEEIRQVIGAALCDPFHGYGADGDDHWNVRLIRVWWWEMKLRLAQIEQLDNNTDECVSFSTTHAEGYLRQYAFFVENRRLPKPIDHLPDL